MDKGRTPDFFIVGAAKSGTTSLSNYLAEHPRVAVVSNRLEFFGEYRNTAFPSLTLKEYLEMFEGYPAEVMLGEKSVSYLYSKEAPREIAELCPEATIFIILRDPVERAYSEYWHRRRTGVEHLSFEEAIKAEKQRIEQGARFELHYITYGFYSECVQRYLDLFGEERVHVFLFDRLRDSPEEICWACFEALGLATSHVPERFDIHNPGGRAKDSWVLNLLFWMGRTPAIVTSARRCFPARLRKRITGWMIQESRQQDYPEMASKLEQRLRGVYQPDIQRLENILGVDLSHWRKTTVEKRKA